MEKKLLPGILLLICAAAVMFYLVYEEKNEDYMKTEVDHLMQVDRDFSAMSRKEGANKAFAHYFDEEAVMLRKNSYPIEGKTANVELMSKSDDTKTTLQWRPIRGEISISLDFGFTYGIYQVVNHESDTVVSDGTYISVWRKNELGKWRLFVDSGNEGLK